MLFALAIAEVAVQGASVVNSGVAFKTCLPAYSHLLLAASIISTSWVGWGRSKQSLSDVRSVFSLHFVELVLDLALVAAYFVIAKGVEFSNNTVTSSHTNEVRWLTVVLVIYFLWDILTKLVERDEKGELKRSNGRLIFAQRGWASFACAILAGSMCVVLPSTPARPEEVILADMSLLVLVFLFRGMKVKGFSELSRKHWTWISIGVAMWLLFFEGAAQTTVVGQQLRDWTISLIK